MITALPDGTAPVPPVVYPTDDPAWRISNTLWNAQQVFDTRLHEARRLRYPRDEPEGSRTQADSRREWVLGQTFAFLEELAELVDALEEQNPDEETVDTLHFTLSLSEKLGMRPQELGRFEVRFAAAAEARIARSWQEELSAVLPGYVQALSALKGAHHKWWKNQPEHPDWEAQKAAVVRIDHLNLRVASHVFPSAEAMFAKYMEKVEENHARQRGEVAGRETYRAA